MGKGLNSAATAEATSFPLVFWSLPTQHSIATVKKTLGVAGACVPRALDSCRLRHSSVPALRQRLGGA